MDRDRRSSARHTIRQRSAAIFSLTVDGLPMPILDIQDVSPLGIGLVVSGRVNNGSKAMICYRYGEIRIEVSGSVAWNLIDGAGSPESSVGIYFDGRQMPLNMEFFSAVTA